MSTFTRPSKATTQCINPISVLQVLCQGLLTIILSFGLLMLAGCSRRYDDVPAYMPVNFKDYPNKGVGRFKTSYLAEQIDAYYRGTNPGPLGVTTFVNLDDLYTTSSFGRMISEQMMSELSMKGFDVVELRHSDALQFLASTGEFALSRDISTVRRERELGGVVVGTYVVSPERVYINARLIDPTSSLVLSAGSVEMSKTTEITKMLRGGTAPATLERIPVRHLGYSAYPMGLMPREMHPWDAEESDYPRPRFPSTGNKTDFRTGTSPIGTTKVEPKIAENKK